MEDRLNKQEIALERVSSLLADHLSGLDKRNAELRKHIAETIDNSLSLCVNGKLDKVHDMLQKQNERADSFEKKMDAHIERVEPVIERFEEEKVFNEGVKKLGSRAIWWAKVVAAIGVIILAVKGAVTGINIKL